MRFNYSIDFYKENEIWIPGIIIVEWLHHILKFFQDLALGDLLCVPSLKPQEPLLYITCHTETGLSFGKYWSMRDLAYNRNSSRLALKRYLTGMNL
jgi:hypothetical protein